MMSKLAILVALIALSTAPRLADAASLTNTFLASSTGSATIEVSDTIQFEVSITTDAGQDYDTIIFSLAGDDRCLPLFCTPNGAQAFISHEVVGWAWHYTPAGGGQVDMGTNGQVSPGPVSLPPPRSLAGGYGFGGVGGLTGDGIPSLVGTVTIHADQQGVYQGGAIQYEGVDGFCSLGGCELATVTGGEFTVVPEPGTGVLLGLACASFAAVRRTFSQR